MKKAEIKKCIFVYPNIDDYPELKTSSPFYFFRMILVFNNEGMLDNLDYVNSYCCKYYFKNIY